MATFKNLEYDRAGKIYGWRDTTGSLHKGRPPEEVRKANVRPKETPSRPKRRSSGKRRRTVPGPIDGSGRQLSAEDPPPPATKKKLPKWWPYAAVSVAGVGVVGYLFVTA